MVALDANYKFITVDIGQWEDLAMEIFFSVNVLTKKIKK
jgi:hypothetical protein